MNDNFKIVNDDCQTNYTPMSYMRTKNGIRGFIGGLSIVFWINIIIYIFLGICHIYNESFNMSIPIGIETVLIGAVLLTLVLGLGVWGWGSDKEAN